MFCLKVEFQSTKECSIAAADIRSSLSMVISAVVVALRDDPGCPLNDPFGISLGYEALHIRSAVGRLYKFVHNANTQHHWSMG